MKPYENMLYRYINTDNCEKYRKCALQKSAGALYCGYYANVIYDAILHPDPAIILYYLFVRLSSDNQANGVKNK